MEPAFVSTLLTQFEEVLSELQEEMQDESCSEKAPIIPGSEKAPIIPASEKKLKQVCFLLTAEEAYALFEADSFTEEEADALSEADFEKIEAEFQQPEVVQSEVVHKHCLAWLPDAELSDAKLSDAELYEWR